MTDLIMQSEWQSFGGRLSVHTHESLVTQTAMTFAVYTPPETTKHKAPFPVIWFLSGLTCTWANVMEKAGLKRIASELGLIKSLGRNIIKWIVILPRNSHR